MTVGWPSNGGHASSISALPALAAQTGAGGTACSLLPAAGSAAAQASPPHRTPIAGLAIPLLTHTCCYSLATSHEPVNPCTVVLPSAWETTVESSLPPCRSLPRPRRRPLPWCSRRGLVNVVNDRHASEMDCTWRGRQLGPRSHTRKCLLITRKIMITPPDSRDPPDGPPYFVKKHSPLLLGPTSYIFARKEVPPLYAQKNEYSPC